MPPTSNVLAFSLAAFVLILIPGPSVLFVVSRALAYGRRAALETVTGNAVGSFVLAVAVALGVGAVVQASAAVLPQFIDRSAGSAGLQMVVLGSIFAAIALGSDAVWGLVAGAARAWFARSHRQMELIGGAAGLTMVGLGLGLAVEGRKS